VGMSSSSLKAILDQAAFTPPGDGWIPHFRRKL
jgi:hypothetical protein